MEHAIRCVEVAKGNQKSYHIHVLEKRRCAQRGRIKMKIDKKNLSVSRRSQLFSWKYCFKRMNVNDALFLHCEMRNCTEKNSYDWWNMWSASEFVLYSFTFIYLFIYCDIFDEFQRFRTDAISDLSIENCIFKQLSWKVEWKRYCADDLSVR